MTDVAALFVERDGIYSRIPGVEVWDISRDARKYAGGLPVVCHPPCQLWTNLSEVNFKRWGGEHNRPGNDGGCFAFALAAVCRVGGLLEHPAFSRAWAKFNLLPPTRGMGWQIAKPGEWACEVWQSAYGHKARKRTWLYYAGKISPLELDWTCVPGIHQCGWFDRIKPTLGKREASATPESFARILVTLARGSSLGR
jgi:hypothetical protein